MSSPGAICLCYHTQQQLAARALKDCMAARVEPARSAGINWMILPGVPEQQPHLCSRRGLSRSLCRAASSLQCHSLQRCRRAAEAPGTLHCPPRAAAAAPRGCLFWSPPLCRPLPPLTTPALSAPLPPVPHTQRLFMTKNSSLPPEMAACLLMVSGIAHTALLIWWMDHQ